MNRSVTVVDDHLLLAETLRSALSERGIDAEVVMPLEPAALLDTLVKSVAGLVLLDLDLGEFGDGTDLIAPLTKAGLRVLVLTGAVERLRIAAALEQGAMGYQSKSAGFDALVTATISALAATTYLDPVGRAALLRELHTERSRRAQEMAPFERLTDREQQTLHALARGRTVRQIAEDWVLSEATVRTHVRAVLDKLAVSSQLEAVAAAFRHGW